MNPFQRLRQAINNVDLNYKFPQDHHQHSQNSCHSHNIPQKVQVLPSSTHQTIAKLWDEKQTQYIREINCLASKVQTLTKNMKLVQIQNEELIRDMVKLQKQNQKLKSQQQNNKQTEKISDEKERKYKEQIIRINKTVEQLGIELNQERSSKKQISTDKTKNQDQLKVKLEKLQNKNQQLQSKIKVMKQQAEQRNKMLQYNFKRNSEQKAQLKRQMERNKAEIKAQNKALKEELQHLKTHYYQTKGELDLEKHKRQHSQAAIRKIERQLQAALSKIKVQQQQMGRILIEKNKILMDLQKLRLQNEQTNILLQHEKNNKKIKVVEVRNEALELQLDMYRRQCKQLLHQRAVMSSLNSSKRQDQSYRHTLEYE